MNNRAIKLTSKNIFLYLFGVFILGFGATISVSSQLGAGPWDTVSKNLSELLGTKLGFASGIVSTSLMIVVLSYTKKWQLSLMIVPIFLVMLSILFWDFMLFERYTPVILWIRIGFYLVGLLAIPLGLSLIILSNFPAFVFDELMIMLMSIFKTERVFFIRILIEVTGVTLGIIFGFLAGIGFGAVGVGSIFMSIFIGPLLAFYLKALRRFQDEQQL